MKAIFSFVALLFILGHSAFAQKSYDYTAAWQKVEKFKEEGLPKSAKTVIDEIYLNAKKEKKNEQLIKAVIYLSSISSELNVGEDYSLSTIQNIYLLEKEIQESKTPVKEIFQSMLAELYSQYLDDNQYRIWDRTNQTAQPDKDIQTWTIKNLKDKIIENYSKSIEKSKELQSVDINQYKEIIFEGNEIGKQFSPTLYDLLAHRAISGLSKNSDESENGDDKYNEVFASSYIDFVKFYFNPISTASINYRILKIYQDLILFHLNDKSPDALVFNDASRIGFVCGKYNPENSHVSTINELELLEKTFIQYPISSYVTYSIAEMFYSEDNKSGNIKKAFDYYQAAIDRYPESLGAELSKEKQQEILTQSLNTKLELYNTPNQPFKALINYKNISKLYWSIVKINKDDIFKLMPSNNDEYSYYRYHYLDENETLNFLKKQNPVYKDSANLIDPKDYLNHSTEIKLNSLPVGDYAIIVSNKSNIKDTINSFITFGFTSVTNITYTSRNLEDGRTQIKIFNRTTGQPLVGAVAEVSFTSYNSEKRKNIITKGDSYTSDKEGVIVFPYFSEKERNGTSFSFDIKWKDDSFSAQCLNSYFTKNQHNQQKEYKQPQHTRTLFFLDREIYRPGQKLYFKGLVYSQEDIKTRIVTDSTFTVSLFDANYNKIEDTKVTLNQFGTFNGTFTTPTGGRLGVMRISIDDDYSSSTYFSVEEYKLPKFEVKMDSINGSFKLNDTIHTSGKALSFSGASIDGAKVNYRVTRVTRVPNWYKSWFDNFYSYPQEISSGETITDAQGNFKIDFQAIPDEKVSKKSNPTFYYTINVDITDVNGETHSNQNTIGVGYQSLQIGVDVKDIDQTKPELFQIKTTNLNGVFEPAKVNIKIEKLKSPDKAYRQRLWEKPDLQILSKEEYEKYFPVDEYADENNHLKWKVENEVFNQQFDTHTKKAFSIEDISKWKTGKYRLEISANDKDGEAVKDTLYFDVYNSTTKQLAVPQIHCFKPLKTNCNPDEKAVFLIGSTEKASGILELELDGKIIDKKVLKFNNNQQKIEIPIKEEYRGNLFVHYCFVNNNRVYTETSTITVPFTNKKLDIQFESFRDKLEPGQKEQWKLKINGANSDKIFAEMVATLYDASLDKVSSHPYNWNYFFKQLNPNYYSHLNWELMNNDFISNCYNVSLNTPEYYIDYSKYFPIYNQLKWMNYGGFPRVEQQIKYIAPCVVDSVKEEVVIATADEQKEIVAEAPPAETIEMEKVDAMALPPPPPPYFKDGKNDTCKKAELTEVDKVATNSSDFSQVQIRKNFNETAFFYPELRTDENGEIVINFTVPEALTRWKMLGFAHTKELASGTITNELVTQKSLMVVPNAPRFFRENDKMVFAVKVTSLIDSVLNGQAQLEFFDALTMQPLNAELKNKKAQQPFTLQAKQSTNLEWNIEIPEGLQAITYRVAAKAGNFSDGEEMAIPVVTNRMLVTETLPLNINGNQTKTFTLDKLLNNRSSTLRNQRYTLEFTSNPAWYAVQALPYLMEYPYECTEQTFSRYYANAIASSVTNSNPKIKRVFDTWATLQPDALLSNLEKNQELKSALLEETPWVLNAKDENQRKRNVALLFDLNRMANEQEKALKKIEEAQSGNGGFSWFPGMEESRYITQHIVAGMGHLEVMKALSEPYQSRIKAMVERANGYLDNQLNKSYQHLKAEAKKGHIKLEEYRLSYDEIHYLYARSYFKDMAVNSDCKEAFDFYLRQVKKYWLQNDVYMDGMVALALNRWGDTTIPQSLIKSLRERALHSEEMGMYWKYNSGYYWYQAPIETQALMIELFDEVANDNVAVEELKTWLLKQKQTQDWKTTKATAEACYALLRRGSDLLSNDAKVEIKVGGEKVNAETHPDIQMEAGTGYFKTAWTAKEITPKMGKIEVTKNSDGVAWGAVYWQYFEQLDKITPAQTPLQLKKQLFKQLNSERGPVITPITDSTQLVVGDLVKVRIELRVDRDMEYIHVKDMRASAFEPVETISTYKYQDGLGYYQATRDLSTNFFIGWMSKGTYVFEYNLRVSQKGDFSNGITTIQSMYAPEFSSHSEGIRVKVE